MAETQAGTIHSYAELPETFNAADLFLRRHRCGEDGCYRYAGRTDDMLKVSGNWVSPAEVESALISHDTVLEVAVTGVPDENGLVKPRAYVVMKPGNAPTAGMEQELKQSVKAKLAPFKCPRLIVFVPELPKTATGKIQRFKLRDAAVAEPIDAAH